MTKDWWQDAIPADFDQGDIFADVPFLETVHPVEPLTFTSMKGGAAGWMKAKTMPGAAKSSSWRVEGRLTYGVLLNHGCDLDKPTSKRCQLVAATLLSAFPQNQHDMIIDQRSIPLMFLPGVPGLGDMVADLRVLTTVPRTLINAGARVAAMTPDARLRLMAQLIEFYARRSAQE